MHIEIYDKLNLRINTRDQMNRPNSQGYKYIITNNWTSHRAFKTLAGLTYWLNLMGFSIDSELKEGESYPINGRYVNISLLHIDPILPNFANSQTLKNWDSESFDLFGKSNKLTPAFVMDNGDYTRAYIYRGINGLWEFGDYGKEITVIYHLNPNCERTIYNWRKFEDGIPFNPDIMEKSY